MKRSSFFLSLLAIALLVFACNKQEPAAPELSKAEKPISLAKVGNGSYVLTAAKWTAAQTAAVEQAGGAVTFSHERSGIGIATSSNPDFLANAQASNVFTGVAQDEMVLWQPPAHEVMLEEEAITPGDETFINLQWNIQAIEAPAAWAAGCTGQGVRVAILDGGIHSSHQDLDGNLDVGASTSFVTGQPFNNDLGTFWHGTHVAGIVAAEDNTIGTIGIAPHATIIGVKVLHSGSGAFSWIISGILYAATPISKGGAGADIINMSLGALFPIGGNTGLLVAALNKAVNFAARNTLVVSAAGNSALDLDHSGNFVFVPAQSGSGIAVSATGSVGMP